MDESDYDEIISTLAKCGRPDLIVSFKEHIRRDYDYRPTEKELREAQQDEQATKHGHKGAVWEDLEVVISKEGFYSLA